MMRVDLAMEALIKAGHVATLIAGYVIVIDETDLSGEAKPWTGSRKTFDVSNDTNMVYSYIRERK